MPSDTVRAWQQIAACLAIALVLAACAGEEVPGRPRPVRVSGVVMAGGEPSANTRLVFSPVDHSYAAAGVTDENGRFELQTFDPGDGAVPGAYRIIATNFKTYELPNGGFREDHFLPSKYRNPGTSGLEATITEQGPNELSFTLEPLPQGPIEGKTTR